MELITNLLCKNDFPLQIYNLIRTLSSLGFFDQSLLIGSWVMLVYQKLYGTVYELRTFDVDFAIHIAHPGKKLRADLERLIIDLGFTGFIGPKGIQKFTGGAYEIEFITHRSGGRDIDLILVQEWNITALPMPFIGILINHSEMAWIDDFTIRFPVPEAYFLHKLIVAQKRMTDSKRLKDLEQCSVIADIVDGSRFRELFDGQRLSKKTKNCIRVSAESIGFPVPDYIWL
jgi:hypothetical protein